MLTRKNHFFINNFSVIMKIKHLCFVLEYKDRLTKYKNLHLNKLNEFTTCVNYSELVIIPFDIIIYAYDKVKGKKFILLYLVGDKIAIF